MSSGVAPPARFTPLETPLCSDVAVSALTFHILELRKQLRDALGQRFGVRLVDCAKASGEVVSNLGDAASLLVKGRVHHDAYLSGDPSCARSKRLTQENKSGSRHKTRNQQQPGRIETSMGLSAH